MSKQMMTIKQACAAFGVSSMCLSHWRKGTATKEALPVETEGRNVFIGVAEAKKWAKAHGVDFAMDPAKAIEADGKPAKKTTTKRGKATH